jgi:hypothetical protein
MIRDSSAVNTNNSYQGRTPCTPKNPRRGSTATLLMKNSSTSDASSAGIVPKSPSLVTSKSMSAAEDCRSSISGMDIIRLSPRGPQDQAPRRERYDPCCPSSPSSHKNFNPNSSSQHQQQLYTCPSRSSGAGLRSNRKRAHSEKVPPKCMKSQGSSSPSYEGRKTPQAHNRRRAYSTGPLVGTTVLVGSQGHGSGPTITGVRRNLSRDSFDSGDSGDGSISSLEESSKGSQKQEKKKAVFPKIMSPKFRPTSAWPADYPQAYPYRHQRLDTNQNHELNNINQQDSLHLKLKDMFIPDLPKYIKPLKNNSVDASVSTAPPAGPKDPTVPCSVKESLPFANTLFRRLSLRSRILKIIVFVSMGIISFSTISSTPPALGEGNTYQYIRVNDKVPQSSVKTNLEDFHTVKNFSGQWGLTLTDEVDEDKKDRTVRGRKKKRQPRLAEANSLKTQHLPSHLEWNAGAGSGSDAAAVRNSKNFVLTDDEIKKKTTSLHERSLKPKPSPFAFKGIFSWVVLLAWICLIGIGLSTVWGEMIRQIRMLRLQLRRKSYNGSSHYHNR